MSSGEALRPAWAEIDLSAVARNLRLLKQRVTPARILAVVKADAYGHGAVQVGRRLAEAGVDWLGVALAQEGVELREAGLELPVLVLGPCQPAEFEVVAAHRLTPLVSAASQLEAWEEWSRGRDRPLEIHLKVDTGMNRLGLALGELEEALRRVRASPVLQLAGLASHLADADELASPANPRQEERFAEAVSLLSVDERERATLHLANSAGALHSASTRYGLVRLGLALYGYDPVAPDPALAPAMSVRARVSLVRDVEAGARAGYGGKWRAARPARLAVVPIGYGDGYPWRLWERGKVLLGGRRWPVAGRISMDMTTVDVTGAETRVGDEAVLLGRQGDEAITAVELADRAGTVPWETLCLFGLRLPRRYLE